MSKKPVAEQANEPVIEQEADAFSKESILNSKRFSYRKDALSFLLEDGETYTFDQVEKILDNFMKGKVN